MFEGLRNAVQAERDTLKAKAKAEGDAVGRLTSRQDAFSGFLEGIQQGVTRGDENTALTYLTQLREAASSAELRKACDEAIGKIQRLRIERDAAHEAEVNTVLKNASVTILSAKEPKDLDAMLAEVGRLSEKRSSRYSDNGPSTVANRVQGALNFLSLWQDYLLAQQRGDESGVNNALRSLAGNSGSYNQTLLVPRSEILARLPTNERRSDSENSSGARARRTAFELDKAVADILDQAHTLDDVPNALAKLEGIHAGLPDNSSYANNNGSDLGMSIQNLQNLQRMTAELRSGLETTINLNQLRGENSGRPSVDGKFIALRADLVKRVLPRLLNVPAEKPAANEGVGAFLRRLVEAAKKRGDWAAVVRGLEAGRSLAASSFQANFNTQETEAFKLFFSGLNLEQARQYQQAVIAYLTALKTGALELPADFIGEHLASIQQAHPRESADANAYVLSPPAPQYPSGPSNPFYNRMMNDPRYNRPGNPPPPADTPSPVLNVPAMLPTATPAPSPTATPVPSSTPTASPKATP